MTPTGGPATKTGAYMRRRRHETAKGENGRNISEGSIACVWLWNGGDGGLPC